MLRKKSKKATSLLTQSGLASSAPAKSPGAQKKKTNKAHKKQKVTEECEEAIPQLVPIGETPDKENVKVLIVVIFIAAAGFQAKTAR
jgi:hypothetical protein